MKKILVLLVPLLLLSCNETPPQPPQPNSQIVAYVHWDNEALAGKKIELVQSGETKLTDSTGQAVFSVSAGKYTIRAYNINHGGPSVGSIDFDVEVSAAGTSKIDIVDCLPCV